LLFILQVFFNLFVPLDKIYYLFNVFLFNTVKHNNIKLYFTDNVEYLLPLELLQPLLVVVIGYHKLFELLVELFVVDGSLLSNLVVEPALLHFKQVQLAQEHSVKLRELLLIQLSHQLLQ